MNEEGTTQENEFDLATSGIAVVEDHVMPKEVEEEDNLNDRVSESDVIDLPALADSEQPEEIRVEEEDDQEAEEVKFEEIADKSID